MKPVPVAYKRHKCTSVSMFSLSPILVSVLHRPNCILLYGRMTPAAPAVE
jgi:hypothetical protein